MRQEWMLTAPWDAIAVRRGDALGFRLATDRLSDILAPDLSNRTQDARWITLLSWCLCVTEKAPWQSNNIPVEQWLRSRPGAAARYDWLRPLELCWVTRTMELLSDGVRERQLPGIRAVRRWKESEWTAERFGLSEDQWARYRQTGAYGAYRTAFRRLPGLTLYGNGWTPGPAAAKLADRVAYVLKDPALRLDDEPINGHAKPETYWINGRWATFRDSSVPALRMLPESSTTIEPLKDEQEREILAGVLFGNDLHGQRRRAVVLACARSPATIHSKLCGDVAEALRADNECESLVLLEPFSEFADAALAAMLALWRQFSIPGRSAPILKLDELTSVKEVRDSADRLLEFAKQWRQVRQQHAAIMLPMQTCDDLARELAPVTNSTAAIRCLMIHHTCKGGGLRWMRLRDESIVPLLPTRGFVSTPYRFRLWQLCRMAVQCDIIQSFPQAFAAQQPEDMDEERADE